ncbi:Homeobox domain-like [Propionibacterium ruminifibrarum]|uniref:Homeobox domain-like n=1 Tax=Propionibacterium ruminifibrarum TaxID=1962131 RepID=A0A375I134_9ACTN|nr:TetR family transcriptional regulator [Propionibacterium ruminifibrarum]SPF68360.1 Homeobox domain-like [Propionibacterium ruminifibrarum]
MNEPQGRRGGASKAPLTRQLIVDSALKLITERGFNALTMRSLAQELETGPAALYVYFKNRQSLVDTLINTVLSEVEIHNAEGDMAWDAQLEALAMRTVESLVRYPGLSAGMVGRVPSAEALLRISERYLKILLDSSHDEMTSLLAVDVLNSIVITEANEISAFEATLGKEHLYEAENVLSGLDPENFPHLSRLSHMAMIATPVERAQWAIHTFTRGLAQTSVPVQCPIKLQLD